MTKRLSPDSRLSSFWPLLRRKGLALLDSAGRACACAGAAVDALFRIDFELAVSHADCAYRALRLTGTTSYTSISDYECHNKNPPL